MVRRDDTTSFADFRDRLQDHLKQSKSTGRPLFVTDNGETEAVILSPSLYEQLVNDAELVKSLALLDESAEDIKAGRVQPAEQAIRQIADELGLNLDRQQTTHLAWR